MFVKQIENGLELKNIAKSIEAVYDTSLRPGEKIELHSHPFFEEIYYAVLLFSSSQSPMNVPITNSAAKTRTKTNITIPTILPGNKPIPKYALNPTRIIPSIIPIKTPFFNRALRSSVPGFKYP